ncbi:MAG: hypothetical protein LBC56_02230 [Oscillospiraceae bacterium]|nr:hypothetical protein [Oscillospiraceae bacterium]
MDDSVNKKSTLREKLVFAVFALILAGFFALNRFIRPPEVSQSERRALAKMPEFSAQSVISGKFMSGFESFAADSFFARDAFRTIRAHIVFDVYRQTDKSGLYQGDYGFGKIEAVNEASYRRAAGKISRLCENFPGMHIYYSVVPDKSIYEPRYMPGFDPDKAREILAEELSGLTFIDLADCLDGESFYKTDLHWDQPKLGAVSARLAESMGFASPEGLETVPGGAFFGVYAGQVAMPIEEDRMDYVTGGALQNVTVKYLDTKSGEFVPGGMYDPAAISGRDPYDFFLGGVQPLIEIENPAGEGTLYFFRDSFGSSLAPWLAASYKKIVLIDLRYIDSRILNNYVSFEPEADALFLYSSQILNNADVLLSP